jgi:hypothetical protein
MLELASFLEEKKAQLNKFHNGKIHKITNAINSKVCVGSTIQKLSIRFTKHKSCYNNKHKNKRNNSVNILFDEDYASCQIELIENYPCSNLSRLKTHEAYWINKLDTVNFKIPTNITNCTKKEYDKKYYEQHKEHKKQYVKQYRQENKEYYKQYQIEYRKKKKLMREKQN